MVLPIDQCISSFRNKIERIAMIIVNRACNSIGKKLEKVIEKFENYSKDVMLMKKSRCMRKSKRNRKKQM